MSVNGFSGKPPASSGRTEGPSVVGGPSTPNVIDARLMPVAVVLWASEVAVVVLIGNGFPPFWVLGSILGLGLLPFALRRHNLGSFTFSKSVAVSILAAVTAGVGLAGLRVEPLMTDSVALLGQARVAGHIEARLSAPPRLSREPPEQPAWANSERSSRLRWTAPATLESVNEGNRILHLAVPVLLTGTSNDQRDLDTLTTGTTVAGSASIRPGEPSRGTALVVRVRGSPTGVGAPPVWQSAAADVRASMRMAASGLDGEAKGLLPALVVGDESGVSDELREQMRRTGLSHLTAVSGANLAIISGAVLAVGMLLRVPRRLSVLLAGCALLGFVVVVGPQPSVLRAAAMGAVALLALFTRRPRAGFSALAVSVTVVLLLDPWMSVSIGFALSVAATAGLLIYAENWRLTPRRRLAAEIGTQGTFDSIPDRWATLARSRLLPWLKLGLGVATAAQLATLPLVASFGDGLPVVGVIANLLAEPAVAFTTVLGCIAAVVGLVAPGPAIFIGQLAGLGAWWISSVARLCSQVPAAVVPWPGGIIGLVLAAVSVVFLMWGWFRRAGLAAAIRSNPRGFATVAAAILAFAAIWRATQPPWPPPGWAVVACDVGQGDALVIATGERRAMVVDAGPDPRAADQCLADLGISAIDLLVLSHFHADHVAGVEGVIEGRPLGGVIVSPLAEPVDQQKAVANALAARSVTPRIAAPGEEGIVGTVRYRVLWPSEVLRGSGSAANNASVVLSVEVGDPPIRVLLTGDLEPPAQQAVLAAQPTEEFDVVKVPHHGSRNQSDSLARSFPAAIALISVGADNTYGHPAPSTVGQWEAVGARVARTDQLGDVAIGRGPDGQLFLVGQGSPGSKS